MPGQTGACTGGGTVTLRQTVDDKVERSIEFGCTNSDGTTPDSSWYRVFSLEEAGVTGAFEVTSVTFGVCFAVGMPEVEIQIGTYGGSPDDTALDVTKVTPVRSTTVTVPATQISKLVEVPLAGTITAGANLIVEVSTADQVGTGQQINIGITAADETRPGFVRSPLCGTANAVSTTTAGAPDAHFVMTVTGTR